MTTLRRRGLCRVVARGKSESRNQKLENGKKVSRSAGSKHFDRGRSTFYTDGMEVKLSPELQAKLDSVAAQQGRDSASLVHEAVERLVGYDEWFIRQVEEGLAQIDRGEVVEHDEVAAPMEKRIAEKQRRS